MSDDLVARLLDGIVAPEGAFNDDPPIRAQDPFNGDTAEKCGRCDAWRSVVRPGKTQCDYCCDSDDYGLRIAAATALTEARAEIERLRAGINGIVNCQGPMTRAQVREACAEILDNKTVGFDNQSPFAAALGDWKVRATTMEISVKEAARSIHNLMTRAVAAESELSTLRAARQLNEDLK